MSAEQPFTPAQSRFYADSALAGEVTPHLVRSASTSCRRTDAATRQCARLAPAAVGALAGMYGTQAGRRLAAGQTGTQIMGQAMQRQIEKNTSQFLRETAAQAAQRLAIVKLLEQRPADQRQ